MILDQTIVEDDLNYIINDLDKCPTEDEAIDNYILEIDKIDDKIGLFIFLDK